MPNVVPQTLPLGDKRLYETLFRNVFTADKTILLKDVKDYCVSTRYRVGSQLTGALELLVNVGVLIPVDVSLRPDPVFLRKIETEDVAFAVSARLLECLASEGEIAEVFPPGSLSLGKQAGELNLHLAKIPLRRLSTIRLLRDLETIRDSDDSAVLLLVQEPLSTLLAAVVDSAFESRRNRRTLSPEALKSLQDAQAELGLIGEMFVLEFERKRLFGHKRLPLIRHVSPEDTAAGYDIESFDGHQSFLPDRFIEVKTFQGMEHFYWSAAEIAAAEELQDKYCLYLVDCKLIELPGYAPRIIRNPTVALFESDPEWSVKAFNFAIAKNNLEDQ